MLIGITYDLRSAYLAEGYGEEETAEFDRDDTITSIADALTALGHDAVRIGHVRDLVGRLANGERWDLVFNICEGLSGAARESQVPAILEAYGIACTFSDAATMALSLNKAWTKAVIGADIPNAQYRVVRALDEVDAIDLPLPLFVKPVSEGTGKGVTPGSVIREKHQLMTECARLLETFKQPVLIETYLPGREFTVGILGSGKRGRVLATFEIVLLGNAEADVYGYINKEQSEERVKYLLASGTDDPVVARAEALSLAVWRKLDCRDAGRLDIRCDELGEPHFIEINPLAGLNPAHSDLPMLATAVGMDFVALVGEIVASASERVVSHGHRLLQRQQTQARVA